MKLRWFRAIGSAVCCLVLLAPVSAQGPARAKQTGPVKVLDPYALAERIDAHWKDKLDKAKAVPAARADDAEFLRRVTLDLIGRIPRNSEIHAFLDDKSPDKRRKLVESMLIQAGYVSNFTTVWRDLLVPQGVGNNQFSAQFGQQMESWLTKKLRDNAGYDVMVRDLLTADPYGGFRRVRGGQPIDPSEQTVVAFYQANENKAENVAATVSRLFLGVKLECAQCHDHPFNQYSREQFWQLAAFFSGLTQQQQVGGGRQPQPFRGFDQKRKEIKIMGTERVVQAKFLDGKEPKFDDNVDVRQTLADWMTAQDNPFFAKAAVNYLWAHFFGLGIIDPVDEPSDENPPSHPELLAEMAQQFALNKYDLKYLIRAITASKAYHLTSAVTHPSQADARLFAAMQLKGMSPEQLIESVGMAVGNLGDGPQPQQQFGQQRNRFSPMAFELRNKFANYSDRRTEYQTSILQALSLMNGKLINDATSLTRSGTFIAIADAPYMDTEAKLNELYLASLSRKMKPSEKARLVRYVEEGGPTKDPAKALTDVFWALLNSSEFILNH